MIVSTSFEPDGLQGTAFIKGALEFAPSQLLRWVLRERVEMQDAETVSLPLDTVPPEVPSVILVSQDNRSRIEIARARINVFRTRTSDDAPLDFKNAAETLGVLLSDLVEQSQVPVGRLAAVAHSSALGQNPAREIAHHFFKNRWLDGPLNRPESLEIHTRKVFQLSEDLSVNSWVRVRSAERVAGSAPIVWVEQDINTLEEERTEREFSRLAIVDFLGRGISEFTTILDLYFPSNTPLEEE